MIGSVVVYTGLILVVAGVVLVVKPLTRPRVTARSRGLVVAGTGVLLTCVGLILPVSESCVTRVETRLDEFAPVWQFHEFHKIRVAASPTRVFEAIKGVRACRGTSSIARSIISRRPAAFAIPFSFMLPASRLSRCSSGSRASQLDASAMMARAISKPAM
jgi:hypothetical protein